MLCDGSFFVSVILFSNHLVIRANCILGSTATKVEGTCVVVCVFIWLCNWVVFHYLDVAPKAWHKRGQFAAVYKLAFVRQPVFSGTRKKLQTCPLKVD